MPDEAIRTTGPYDLSIRGGTVYDGDGGDGRRADVAIAADRIVAVGEVGAGAARRELDAGGLAVAPGFVNVLSWATESLMVDGRAMSDLKQGVTLEVLGEGTSWGPVDERVREMLVAQQGYHRYPVHWTTLGEYLERLVAGGVSVNVGSYVGATTVRVHELGQVDRAPTARELTRMQDLVRGAMAEGAFGVSAALIYAPAAYAATDELVALATAAGESGGLYVSHLRSEGDRFLEALDELLEIARRAGVRAEVYHLKAAGRRNWDKLPRAIERIESARRDGLEVTADMYPYPAASTGLDAAMPPWVQEGGLDAWLARLAQPEVRRRVVAEMTATDGGWENFLRAAGPEGIRLVGFRSEALRPLAGRTLAEVAAERGTSPAEAAIDLVVADRSRVGCVYFLMSEDNVRRQVRLPWVSFGSDAEAPSLEPPFRGSPRHPRAFGTFARILGRYVRDEGLVPLGEAVRRLAALPCHTLRIADRGRVLPGYFADLAVFDPATIQDHATFDDPYRYATGVHHVVVNGTPALVDGEPTAARPGRVVRGPGWRGRRG